MIRLVRAAEYMTHPLLAENWAETGFDFPLAPDPVLIGKMEDQGVLFALGAFDGEALIGYSGAIIGGHHFNPGVLVCHSSALFVSPRYRAGTTAGRLIHETESEAFRRGGRFMCWNTRSGTSMAAAFIKRGYEPADTVVMRKLWA